MIVKCQHCQKQLKLSDKVRDSIAALEPGRKVKLKCIHCGVPFSLDAGALGTIGTVGPQAARPAATKVPPPAPPDLSWLREGVFEDQDVVEDIPRALVLMADSEMREIIYKSVENLGYMVELAVSAEEAIDKMRFVNYAAVFLHSRYEPGGLENGTFHAYMRTMNMSRRRYIFYVLIGEQFETLYDLQAMAFSANLVVNDSEIQYIGTILKKAIPEYETLFGPLMEELQVAGK
jgi:CheY-like chemotaxis protein